MYTHDNSSRRKPPASRSNARQPVRALVGQRPPFGIHHSSTTTPSSDDDGSPAVANGNGLSENAIATGNGLHHDTNGATVSGVETHNDEFTGESA